MSALERLVEQGAVTVPQRLLMQLENLSINMLVGWYRSGELDSGAGSWALYDPRPSGWRRSRTTSARC